LDSQRQLISRIQRELNNFNYVVQIVKAYDSTKFGDEIEALYTKNLELFTEAFSTEEEETKR
jgi:hypothetical protein